MANTYFKILNNNVKDSYTDNVINGIQKDLLQQAKILKLGNVNADLYALAEKKQNVAADLDINVLLKCYLVKQLLNENVRENEEQKLEDTANPNIKKDIDNKFYKKVKNKFEEADNIETVNDDGSYIVVEQRMNSVYKVKKTIDKNEQLICIQLINGNDVAETNLKFIIEYLDLKKVYAYKHKYSGYSGNSFDFVAGILNKISAPFDTGCYMDRTFNCYFWSSAKQALIRDIRQDSSTPFLVEYEFAAKGNVIRKEYTGA